MENPLWRKLRRPGPVQPCRGVALPRLGTQNPVAGKARAGRGKRHEACNQPGDALDLRSVKAFAVKRE